MNIQEKRAFAKADQIFTICTQVDMELNEYGRIELLRLLTNAADDSPDLGMCILWAILRTVRNYTEPGITTIKEIPCQELPNVVARLADYGLRVTVSNLYNVEGTVTDYFKVIAYCTEKQWDAAMERTPMWL